MRPAAIVIALCIAAASTTACGVAFSNPSRSNTLFQSLEVTGVKAPGEPLTAAVAYQQYLPVRLNISCDLWKGSNKVKAIGTQTVPELPDGSPQKTPFPGNFSLDFTVDNPGSYGVKCYTTNDADNTILTGFTVHAAPDHPTPAPTP